MGDITPIRDLPVQHKVHIRSRLAGRQQSDVFAHCPDSFQVTFQNKWASPFSNVSSPFKQSTFGQLLNSSGNTLTSQEMTVLTWESTSIPSISLSLEFHAERDPQTDVLDPLAALIEMSLPFRENAGDFIVKTPGPSSAKYVFQSLKQRANGQVPDQENLQSDVISIQIGSFFYCYSVVVESVTLEAFTRAAGRYGGKPIMARAAVTFKPFVAPFAGDVQRMFGTVGEFARGQ